MLRTIIVSALLVASSLATPAFAQAAPANRGYTVAETKIGTLVDDPEAKAILDKYLPGFSSDPRLEMGKGFSLKQVQQFVGDQLTDETLAAIDADLAKLAPKPASPAN